MSDWFENKLDDHLGNYGSPLNLNQTWDELEARRNRRRRRPVWLWWSAGAFVLVVAMIFSLQLNSAATEPPSLGCFFALSEKIDIQKEEVFIQTENTQPVVTKKRIKRNTNLIRRSLPETPPSPIAEPVLEHTAVLSAWGASSKTRGITFLPVVNQDFIESKSGLLLTVSGNDREEGQASPSGDWELHTWGAYGIAGWPETPGPLDVQPVDGWKTFLGLRKSVFNRWNISTGIQFEQFFTRLTYSAAVSYEEIRPGQVVEIYQFQDGTEEEVISDAPVMVEEELEFDAWQRHRFLSIPVFIGYTQPLSSRSALSLQAGSSVSLWADHRGSYLQPASTGAIVADLQDLEYNKSGGWSGMILLQYERQLSRRWMLSAHVQGSSQLTPNRSDRDVYPEKFSFLGGGLGLSYRLN